MKIQVIYATETGTSQDIASSIHRHLCLAHLPCAEPISVKSFDPLSLPLLVDNPLIFVVSTTGNGEPPRDMRPLWDMIMRVDLPADVLEDVRFCVFGIGDSGYERFNWAAKILRRRLKSLGAEELMGESEWWGDERAGGGIEGTLHPFLGALTTRLLPEYYDQPEPPFPPTHLFPPTSRATILSTPPSGGTETPGESIDLPSFHKIDLDRGLVSNCWGRDQRTVGGTEEGWRPGTLAKFDRMTEPDWNQDVRIVEFKTKEGLIYSPGSILQLVPSNSSATVDQFLALQPHLPPPSALLVFHPSSTELEPAFDSFHNLPITLLELLRDHLDLSAVPRRSFFEWMRVFTEDEREQERLDEFLHHEDGPEDLYEYAHQPRRNLLEVLSDFRGVRIPLDYLPQVFGRMRRREFSIAGSSIAHPGVIQLCIAMVRYKTSLKLPRSGLCTTWLSALDIGTTIPIRVVPGTMSLPSSADTPVILVGPGTGVAPLRAFIEQRALEGASDTTLYYGCRKKEKDYLFREDWERLEKQGSLRLRVAASRDQEDKVYVQHLIRQDDKLVYEALFVKKGRVYISGSSNAMPRAVKAALHFCFMSAGAMSDEEAKQYMGVMEAEGRLAEECWS